MAKYKVLLVDDSITSRTLVAKSLATENEIFEVCGEAENGEEAIQKYQELNPDLITMDINMHKMDGKQALVEILKINPSAVVVMLTSEGKTQALEAISLGAKDYIEKPATADIIKQKLKSVMGV